MSKITLITDFQTPPVGLTERFIQSGVGKKGALEVPLTFEALKAWSKELTREYGGLRRLTHLSDPDDPPDFVAQFERHAVSIEHTALQTTTLGMVMNLSQEHPDKHFWAPSVYATKKPARKLFVETIQPPTQPNPAEREWNGYLECLIETVRKKLKDHPDILVITDRLIQEPLSLPIVITEFSERLADGRVAPLIQTSIILYSELFTGMVWTWRYSKDGKQYNHKAFRPRYA